MFEVGREGREMAGVRRQSGRCRGVVKDCERLMQDGIQNQDEGQEAD